MWLKSYKYVIMILCFFCFFVVQFNIIDNFISWYDEIQVEQEVNVFSNVFSFFIFVKLELVIELDGVNEIVFFVIQLRFKLIDIDGILVIILGYGFFINWIVIVIIKNGLGDLFVLLDGSVNVMLENGWVNFIDLSIMYNVIDYELFFYVSKLLVFYFNVMFQLFEVKERIMYFIVID